jgi:hypothetical protein
MNGESGSHLPSPRGSRAVLCVSIILLSSLGPLVIASGEDAETGSAGTALHFSAHITASASHHDDTEGEEPTLDDSRVEWSGDWPDVAIQIVNVSDDRIDFYPMDEAGANGQIEVANSYHKHYWKAPTGAPVSIDCTGSYTKTYPARLWFTGSTERGRARIEITLGTDRSAAGPSDPEVVREAFARCDNAAPDWPGRREFSTEPQLTFELDPTDLAARVYRFNSPTLPLPVKAALSHRPFRVATGRQDEEENRERYHWREQWDAQIRFTPLKASDCARHASPIADGDPVVEREEITLDPEHSEIRENGETSITLKITCDGTPIKDAQVEVEVRPQKNSGGHVHGEKRPRGSLNGKELTDDKPSIPVTTDADGEAQLKFEVPTVGVDYAAYGNYKIGVAGIYEIKATSRRFPDSVGTTAITARAPGLQPLGAGDNYVIVRGGLQTHPDGTWATKGTAQAFTKLADDLRRYQDLHNAALTGCNNRPQWLKGIPKPVSINDIALPMGGVFDFHESWKPPHQTHNRGEGGDFNRFGDVHGTGVECDGSKRDIRTWLLHTLIELGTAYGHWDCKDFGQPPNSPGCAQADFKSDTWVPPDLHLHVED